MLGQLGLESARLRDPQPGRPAQWSLGEVTPERARPGRLAQCSVGEATLDGVRPGGPARRKEAQAARPREHSGLGLGEAGLGQWDAGRSRQDEFANPADIHYPFCVAAERGSRAGVGWPGNCF